MENLVAKQERRRRVTKKKGRARTAPADTALRRGALRAVRHLLTQAEASVRLIDRALRKALKPKRRNAKAGRQRKKRGA